ncbi:hypothetical protein MPTK1_5g02220 [Marchantia polymorpha subsp. ruderalis]|uniref:Uncharacterized protein n=2 Tax=Marchantia polymorpha TaxID=3197 RepID=A0AAF6BE29_MARPO|nr:hypothetical protein MARPO_0147s0015 [Marchantia polymorpha]BBN10263.1 hypothetical protein Mp_5g02220 [Marchantia polymorpha subsp. ruderalis]|eukprot:PTQ29124.1 hypothetical protein MARPO_0147s0015 [Marchantia polymorpha]
METRIIETTLMIRSWRNKVQISRSVRMPQLHTLLHFHLAPIFHFLQRLHSVLSMFITQRLLQEKKNRRELILRWASYFDDFSSYPLRTWLPSVYRGHDNWYTRGASFPVLLY